MSKHKSSINSGIQGSETAVLRSKLLWKPDKAQKGLEFAGLDTDLVLFA